MDKLTKVISAVIISVLLYIPATLHAESLELIEDYSKSLKRSSVIDEIKVLITDEGTAAPQNNYNNLKHVSSMSGLLMVKGQSYNGRIDIYKDAQGMYIVNSIPVEEYVKAVVSSEINQNWNFEAMKMQAVIARTYAMNYATKRAKLPYHLTSTTDNQVYHGSQFNAMVSRAVEMTKGEVLTYNNEIIVAYYHSTSGGRTEQPEEVFGKSYPYLASVKSDSSLSPYTKWSKDISYEEIERTLNVRGITNISITSYTKTGRVKHLKIASEGRNMVYDARDFRRALGYRVLPSTLFTIENTEDGIRVEGSGFGHGVGLDQWGALNMAREGKNYREILSHYYPNTAIQLYEDL